LRPGARRLRCPSYVPADEAGEDETAHPGQRGADDRDVEVRRAPEALGEADEDRGGEGAGELERRQRVDRAAAQADDADRNEPGEHDRPREQEVVHAGSSERRHGTRSWRSTTLSSGSMSTT